jgi:hypothetical protein
LLNNLLSIYGSKAFTDSELMTTLDELKKAEALRFITAIESQVENMFEQFKNLSYNANTKGFDYEYAFFKILKEYLGSRFNFYLRPHIIDKEMKYLEILGRGENEVDIAATFKSTIPRVVLRTKKTDFVLFDTIAFLVECKAVLNSQSIRKDLSKLEKLASLGVDPNRFSDTRGSEFIMVDRPLRILLYERKLIKEQKLNSVLNGNNFWDLIYLTKDKITIVNKSTIPFANFLQEKIRGSVTTTQVMDWEDAIYNSTNDDSYDCSRSDGSQCHSAIYKTGSFGL